jgi:hypothetical protein
LCTPPIQWMSRTISGSTSAITSWITVRTIRLFSRARPWMAPSRPI